MANSWGSDEGWMSDAELEAAKRRQADPNRGSILPFYKGKDGLELAWPQFMVDAYNAVTLPSDTLKGYKPTVDDTTNFALNVGGVGAGASAAIAPEADLGMFLGRKAKGADTRKLAEAMTMTSQGAPREDVWRQTGWWKKPDGEWSWEMSDEAFQFPPETVNRLETEGYDYVLPEDVVPHVTSQYGPKYNNMPVMNNGFQQIPLEEDGLNLNLMGLNITDQPGGVYDSSSKALQARGRDLKELKSVALHEVQHAVQKAEGWKGKGSNPEWTAYLHNKVKDEAPDDWKRWDKLHERMKESIDKHARISLKIEEAEEKLKSPLSKEEKQKWEEELYFFKMSKTRAEKEHKRLVEESDDLYVQNPEISEFEDKYTDFLNKFGPTKFDTYFRDEGETLANITSTRANMTDKERKDFPPWMHYGEKFDYVGTKVPFPKEEELWVQEDFDNFFKQWKDKNPKSSLEDFNRDLQEAMNGGR